MVVRKAYGRYEAKLIYDPHHLIGICMNARTGDLYGRGLYSRNLYPLSFSPYFNKLLLHSEAFRKIFRDLLELCSDGDPIMKDIVRTIDEEGYLALPASVFDIRKCHTKDELIRNVTGTDLPVNFNRRSLNHAYALAELSKAIPPEQTGYLIQTDRNMITGIVRSIYEEAYPLEDFVMEFIVRYYVQKLRLEDSIWNRRMIEDYINMARDHDERISINFRTSGRLLREHDRLAGLYRDEDMSDGLAGPLIAEDTKFAELRRILPDEFEWITTSERLFEEGSLQNNCVFSYRDKIRNDRSTVYHWSTKDGRSYTIEFGCSADGRRFTIEQMLQAKNTRAEDADVEYVKKCLGSRLGDRSDATWAFEADFGNFGNIMDNGDLPF